MVLQTFVKRNCIYDVKRGLRVQPARLTPQPQSVQQSRYAGQNCLYEPILHSLTVMTHILIILSLLDLLLPAVPALFQPEPAMLQQLVRERRVPPKLATTALFYTGNMGVISAWNWILIHQQSW